MQDRNTNGTADALRRAILCSLTVAGVLAAAVVAPRLGWAAGLGILGAVTLVLVVILLAVVPDDDAGQGTTDTAL